jgi:hypothetical protein
MSRWTDKFSYWTGTQIAPDRYAFLLGRDDLMEKRTPHTVLATLDKGTWVAKSFPWTSVGVCWGQKPVKELVLVGHEGHIAAGPVGNLEKEDPIDIEPEDGKVGHLRCARSIAGRVYIGGMDRQMYRRTASGWESLDEGMPGAEEDVVGFEAIDGFSEKEIYAVGHEGEMWEFNGKKWRQISSPTNLILLGVHCAPDGFVYVSGQAGLVLKGRHDEWQIVEQTATREDIWEIALFKGTLYLATRGVLYQYRDDTTEPVDFGETEIPFTFYKFIVSDDQLITVGSKDVMRFDGTTWSRID